MPVNNVELTQHTTTVCRPHILSPPPVIDRDGTFFSVMSTYNLANMGVTAPLLFLIRGEQGPCSFFFST